MDGAIKIANANTPIREAFSRTEVSQVSRGDPSINPAKALSTAAVSADAAIEKRQAKKEASPLVEAPNALDNLKAAADVGAEAEQPAALKSEDVEETAKKLQEELSRTSLRFSTVPKEGSQGLRFQIVDQSGEVIKEFPPEALQDILTKVKEFGGGLLVDDSV